MAAPLKNALAWLGKEVARAVLLPLVGWLASVVALLLPPVMVWILRGGVGFLTTSHPIPGWTISLTSSCLLISFFFLIRQRVQLRKRRPDREEPFQWRGLEWVLGPDFWAVYRTLPVADIAPGFLKGCVRGPFCARCKRDPTVIIDSVTYCIGRCPHCPTQFDAKDFSEELEANLIPIEFLRQKVYVEAQGAARKKEA